jgi:autotransporter-associated beta strand protein
LLLASAGLVVGQAQSTFYWDRNGAPAGAGNTSTILTGTWDTTTANWNDTSTGSNATEKFVSGSNAVFSAGTSAAGVGYTVTVSGTQNANSISVEEGTVTFSGGTINLVGPSFTIASGLTTTVNSVVSGSSGLTKLGDGTLLLAGTNTYSGGTTLSAGTLSLGNNNALGSGTLTIGTGTTITASGGSRAIANNVNVGGNFTIGGSQALTFNGTINLGGGNRTITVDNTAVTTFAGSVTEPYYSGLEKAGTGQLVLSGNNSFTAPVTVSAGTLTLAHNNALGGAGTWNNTVASGATLAVQNNITVNEGSFNIQGTGAGGTGAIRNISGNNTLGGTINLDGDTTITSASGSLTFTGSMAASNNLTTSGAGSITLAGAGYGGGNITQNGSGSGTGTLTFSGSGSNSYSGVLSINDGTVALAKTGGATAVASSAINIGNGSGAAGSAVLRLEGNHQIADHAGLITIASDGLFNVNGFTEKVNSLTSTGTIGLGAGSLTVGVNSGNVSLGGSITGAGTLIKEGSGTLALLSSIVLAGELQLKAGTLALSGYNLTADTLHITGNSVIDFGGGNSTLNLSNFIIDAGVTLTIQNWTAAADYFYTQGWTGASFGTGGSAPMNQVVFTGYSANSTHWDSYDKQITPVPEPSTYGLLMLLGASGFAAWRRRRRV